MGRSYGGGYYLGRNFIKFFGGVGSVYKGRLGLSWDMNNR